MWSSDVDSAGARRQLTTHTVVGGAVVGGGTAAGREALRATAERVAISLGVDARRLTLDEYSLAAVMASEDGDATPETLASIGDATLNRAAHQGVGVYACATTAGGVNHGFGAGTGGRPMSTARAPRLRHLRVALALTRGGSRGPRGVSRGARAWLHHATQARLAAADSSRHCPPDVVVQRWCWGNRWADVDAHGRRTSCRLGPNRAPALEWIGRTTGVDPSRLLLFRPATPAHAAQYRAAMAVVKGEQLAHWVTPLVAYAVAMLLALGVSL